MTAVLHQTSALFIWNVRSIPRRARNAAVVIISFLVVVLVFISVLSVSDGILRSETRPGTNQLAIVSGSHGPFDTSALNVVSQAPGIVQIDKKPAFAPVDSGALVIRNWRPDMLGIASIMTIDAKKAAIIPNFRVVAGRKMRPGFNEMMMGEGAVRIYPEYLAGRSVLWRNRKWNVVGVYSTGSLTRDSQFMVDLHQFQDATRAGNKFSEIYARLVSPAAITSFKNYIAGLPNLGATVKTMAEEDEEVGRQFRTILIVAVSVITSLMAAGAVFAALNVMYANVTSRAAELALLRTLGFSRFPVLAAILSEAVLLAVAGGTVGILLAVLGLDGLQARTLMGGWLVSFRLAVTPLSILLALVLTLGMGLVGGLFPAIRAAYLSPATALRDA
jgi:putative ABC transport system permease protein